MVIAVGSPYQSPVNCEASPKVGISKKNVAVSNALLIFL
jgi:hypothetical protein